MATKNQIGIATGDANTLLQGSGAGSVPTFQASPEVSGTFTAGTGMTSTTGDIQASDGEVIAYGHHKVYNQDASTSAHAFISYKDRSGGAITSGDTMGQIEAYGHDGTGYVRAASIKMRNTGTVATDRIGSTITFLTHPDSTSPIAKRLTIGSTGLISIEAPDSGNALEVDGFIDSTSDVQARTFFADGDEGTGKASTTALTNGTETGLSSGTLTINGTTANPGSNTGFIKMYIGTTAVWVPYFDDIAP